MLLRIMLKLEVRHADKVISFAQKNHPCGWFFKCVFF
jgi:hypothetical protein